MKNLKLPALFICLLLVFSGCFESKEEYTLNPDGSGKVKIDITFAPVDLGFDSQPSDPEEKAKKTAKEILAESKGVETWKEVSFKNIDGKVNFKGTAYFKDFSKFELSAGGMNNTFYNFELVKTDEGKLHLKEKKKEDEEKEKKEMTEEELEKEVADIKEKWNGQKQMIILMLGQLKKDVTFVLPGEIEKSTNFTKKEDGSLGFVLHGTDLVATMENIMKDDEALKEMAKNNADPQKGTSSKLVNEYLFGEKAPVEAVVGGEMKPLFDYAAEAAAAKKAYKDMVDKLDIAPPPPPKPASKAEFKTIDVIGVQFIYDADQKQGLRPFGKIKPGCSIYLACGLDGAFIVGKKAVLEKAVTDNDEDLLPESEWDRKVTFLKDSKDKTAFFFEVKMKLPSEKAKYFKEVSGYVEYVTATGTKEVDLGFGLDNPVKNGAKGTKLGAVIKTIENKTNSWEKGYQGMKFELDTSKDNIKEVKFLDKDGNALEVKKGFSRYFNNKTTLEYKIKGEFPEDVKVVVVMHDNIQTFKAPFKVEKLDLMGKPVK